VRRARNATDGRFQSQQVTLNALGGTGLGGIGESIGGTKTETLEAIHQRLGLSFDQFRRSALLAQGEFAAFLRADGKDRSELLERMTGTEIYSKLSIAAHVKAALAEQQLRERHGAALAIATLSDEERAKAESDLVLARAAQAASRVRFAAAEAAARWLGEAERRAGALVEAEATRTEVDRAVEAAAAERAELALRRRAETLRSPWDEAARLDRQLTQIRSEATAAAEAAARSTAAQREIEAIRTQLLSLHAPIREARIAAGLIEVASSTRGEDLVARAQAAVADATWLLGRRDLGLAVAGWPFLDQQLAQHATLAAEIAGSDRILDDRSKRRGQLCAQRAAADAAHPAALGRLALASAEATTYQHKRGLSLDAARGA
jgi:exonuclease SbcC